MLRSAACGHHVGNGGKGFGWQKKSKCKSIASPVVKRIISWLTHFIKVPLYQGKVQSINWLFLDRQCLSQSISCKPSCLAAVGWLGRGLSNSLQHLSAQEQSLLCLILLAPLHADPPTISLSYDYFIILNSLCRIAVASSPLEQSGALAIQYIHTTVIWTALRCGSVPVPRLDSARPLVPSVPSCAVCEGPVDAKTIGISLEQPEGRCPELFAANDVHLLWQNQRGWGGGGGWWWWG